MENPKYIIKKENEKYTKKEFINNCKVVMKDSNIKFNENVDDIEFVKQNYESLKQITSNELRKYSNTPEKEFDLLNSFIEHELFLLERKGKLNATKSYKEYYEELEKQLKKELSDREKIELLIKYIKLMSSAIFGVSIKEGEKTARDNYLQYIVVQSLKKPDNIFFHEQGVEQILCSNNNNFKDITLFSSFNIRIELNRLKDAGIINKNIKGTYELYELNQNNKELSQLLMGKDGEKLLYECINKYIYYRENSFIIEENEGVYLKDLGKTKISNIDKDLKNKYDYFLDPTSSNNSINKNNSIESSKKNIPKCPTCGSTNVSKISTINRGISIGLFGLFSGEIGKTMECKNCGYKW